MSRSSTGVLGSRLAVAVTSVIVTTVVVAGGIAVASVPNNSVTTAKLANNSVTSAKIRDGTIQDVDIGTGAVTSRNIRDGSVGVADLAPAARPLFARVGNDADNNPVLVAGRGVTSVVKRGEPEVDYLVTFNRSIADCGWTATINNNNNYFGPPTGWGPIYAENDGNPFTTGPPNALRVRLFTMATPDAYSQQITLEAGAEPTTFTVTATC